MELGVLPVAPASPESPSGFFEEVTPDPSRVRLMATIRRIDPLVADLIESLPPAYLVKR